MIPIRFSSSALRTSSQSRAVFSVVSEFKNAVELFAAHAS